MAYYLGNMLAKLFLDAKSPVPDSIIPVPLHPTRLIYRGYNQSIELARPLAKQLGVKMNIRLCKRTRYTAPQTTLSIRQRRSNVRNAFSVTDSTPYKHVLLIDDVITTGSTIIELSRMLYRAGVKKIDVLACARTDGR